MDTVLEGTQTLLTLPLTDTALKTVPTQVPQILQSGEQEGGKNLLPPTHVT